MYSGGVRMFWGRINRCYSLFLGEDQFCKAPIEPSFDGFIRLRLQNIIIILILSLRLFVLGDTEIIVILWRGPLKMNKLIMLALFTLYTSSLENRPKWASSNFHNIISETQQYQV